MARRKSTPATYADLQHAGLTANTPGYVAGSQRAPRTPQIPQASRIPAPTFTASLSLDVRAFVMPEWKDTFVPYHRETEVLSSKENVADIDRILTEI
ncbi:hypothetical protein N7467_008535 [Penicillium canescens]|nr:hypothetical protein N7467_008535 [Penicillium canescens]